MDFMPVEEMGSRAYTKHDGNIQKLLFEILNSGYDLVQIDPKLVKKYKNIKSCRNTLEQGIAISNLSFKVFVRNEAAYVRRVKEGSQCLNDSRKNFQMLPKRQ